MESENEALRARLQMAEREAASARARVDLLEGVSSPRLATVVTGPKGEKKEQLDQKVIDEKVESDKNDEEKRKLLPLMHQHVPDPMKLNNSCMM